MTELEYVEDKSLGVAYFQDPEIPIAHAFSTRYGGVSQGHYRGLNLGYTVGDSEQSVTENRNLLAQSLGLKTIPFFLDLVHGDTVVELEDYPSERQQADAGMTNKPGLTISVTTADCLAVLLYDRRQSCFAVVHAGWRGVLNNISGKALNCMVQRYGSQLPDFRIALGPCIGPQDFEVGQEVIEQFAQVCPVQDFLSLSRSGKGCLDLQSLLCFFLQKQGIQDSQFSACSLSTASYTDMFFSHRAEQGKTGRQLLVACKSV